MNVRLTTVKLTAKKDQDLPADPSVEDRSIPPQFPSPAHPVPNTSGHVPKRIQ